MHGGAGVGAWSAGYRGHGLQGMGRVQGDARRCLWGAAAALMILRLAAAAAAAAQLMMMMMIP